MNVISCRNIKKTFGGVTALVGVSVEFRARECVALVGPNGAGKTTLLNVLSGFLKPDGGQCIFRGRNVAKLGAEGASRLGMCRTFQEVRVLSQATIEENVLLAFREVDGHHPRNWFWPWRSQGRLPKQIERVGHILESVSLDEHAGVLAGALSYGQKKLLTLGMCLAASPDVIMLDEPTSGLDDEKSEVTVVLLQRIVSSGALVIFIEHDFDAVRRLASRAVAMSDGRIVEEGEVNTVLTSKIVQETLTG